MPLAWETLVSREPRHLASSPRSLRMHPRTHSRAPTVANFHAHKHSHPHRRITGCHVHAGSHTYARTDVRHLATRFPASRSSHVEVAGLHITSFVARAVLQGQIRVGAMLLAAGQTRGRVCVSFQFLLSTSLPSLRLFLHCFSFPCILLSSESTLSPPLLVFFCSGSLSTSLPQRPPPPLQPCS